MGAALPMYVQHNNILQSIQEMLSQETSVVSSKNTNILFPGPCQLSRSNSSISSTGTGSRTKGLKKSGGSPRHRMPHWFLCRHGARHWFRIASTRQKYELLAVLALSVLTTSYYLFTDGTRNESSVDPAPATESRLIQLERDVSAAFSSVHVPLPHFPPLPLSQQHHALGFEERNFLPQDFNPNTDLSTSEWTGIKEKVHSLSSKKVLVAWPTIPVPYKGSDSRAVDAIRLLSQCGFEVDLIYWRDFASEIHNDEHDDTPERETLAKAGAQRILGPYDTTKLSDSHTFVSSYQAVIFWLWPHVEWLDALIDFVEHIARMNGQTKMIAAVDDVGVAARLLQGALLQEKAEEIKQEEVQKLDTMERVQKYILAQRPLQFVGLNDTAASDSPADIPMDNPLSASAVTSFSPQHFDPDKFQYAKVLLHQEMFLYTMSDVLVGINEPTVKFLKQMAPSVPVHRLSYVSPVQPALSGIGNFASLKNSKPFSHRSGYVFFGYNNFANNEGMDWFARHVLPNVDAKHKLHIAGKVYVPSLCSCDWSSVSPSSCRSLKSNVVCHGALSDEELDALISSSRVAINPVMEPSGVATKTCRAMALGTPVVVTDQDGTFDDTRTSIGGTRCTNDGKGTDAYATCFVQSLTALLDQERDWRHASEAAPLFVTEHFGAGRYKRDWLTIVNEFTQKKYQIVLQGDADFNGWSLESQNWHIVKMLSEHPQLEVTVMAEKYDPIIPGTRHVQPLRYDEISGTVQSPFSTGFQVDLMIRQSWPPNFEPSPANICGSGCRVVQILPWEFGYLPETWMSQINSSIDWLWAPSEYNRRVYERSGFRSSSTAVVPAGVDCETLLASSDKKAPIRTPADPVTFIFTGGFIPRKGVDILLEEWETVFCGDGAKATFGTTLNVKLILQTSYELGYSPKEISEFEKIVEKCGNVEWKRGWMGREEYLAMLKEGDVYIAPFRSEGFGIPIVESMVLGLSAIASVGGTAADDYMTAGDLSTLVAANGERVHDYRQTLYPVHANEATCTKDPCHGDSLCVFLPCRFGSCACQKLVNNPSWFEVNRDDLRKQMTQVYQDTVARRESSHSYDVFLSLSAHHSESVDNDAKSFCWSNLSSKYHDAIMTVMKSPMHRVVPTFQRPDLVQTPPLLKQLKLMMKSISLGVPMVAIALVCCALVVWKQRIRSWRTFLRSKGRHLRKQNK